MTTRNSLVHHATLFAFGLLLASTSHAADQPEDPAADQEASTKCLPPGTKCIVTVDLDCEIREIKNDTVFIRVTALREAEQGVPMLDKLPHTERLFKSAGIVRTETDVILAVPRERIEVATPSEAKGLSDEAHVQHAVKHLKAAGLEELAEQLHQRIQRQARREKSREKRKKGKPRGQQAPRLRTDSDGDVSSGSQQVLVELKVVEISRTKLRALGLDFKLSGPDEDLPKDATNRKQGWREAIASRIVHKDDSVLKLVEQLRATGVAKILAEPTVVTLAGRPASFHSGGEFPVPVPQGGGQVVTEYRKFGTHVNLVPVDLGEGKLRLEIRASVSELDLAASQTIGDRHVPGVRTRTVDTTAELAAGQTLIVSGLVQTRPTGARADEADGRKRKSEEVELLLLATPRLVDGSELANRH